MLRNMDETMYKLSQESKIQMKIQAGAWILKIQGKKCGKPNLLDYGQIFVNSKIGAWV